MNANISDSKHYVGRLAPTPSGQLHVGHAQTFGIAYIRAKYHNPGNPGTLMLRIEDLDRARCKPIYLIEMLEDLLWFGIPWTNHLTLTYNLNQFNSNIEENWKKIKLNDDRYTLDCKQSDNMELYKKAWYLLFTNGYIYPSPQSRKDVESAISAPHEGDAEVIFPIIFRPDYMSSPQTSHSSFYSNFPLELQQLKEPNNVNWRFKVPDGRNVSFTDNRCGSKEYICGVDFGDFVVWRGSDSIPSYELAVVVDDICMGITEVVRGEDLLLSTARQILLYEALYASGFLPSDSSSSTSSISNIPPSCRIPEFYHCPLIRDETGKRLAKRSPTRTIRSLREEGYDRQRIIKEFFNSEFQEMFLSMQTHETKT